MDHRSGKNESIFRPRSWYRGLETIKGRLISLTVDLDVRIPIPIACRSLGGGIAKDVPLSRMGSIEEVRGKFIYHPSVEPPLCILGGCSSRPLNNLGGPG